LKASKIENDKKRLDLKNSYTLIYYVKFVIDYIN